jgi:NAD(P)H-quinone oxidoreductase subunit 5
MTTHVAGLFALLPVVWLATALLCRRGARRPQLLRGISLGGALLALMLVAIAATALLYGHAGSVAPVPGAAGLVRLDAVSLTMAALVNFIGLVVLRYSHAYLHGDPRQHGFLAAMCLTVGAVSLLAIAANAWLLFIGWVSMSLCLHRLLVFRRERRRARFAARKKFLLARLGDAALGLALLSLGLSAGSADLAAISAMVAAAPAGSFSGPALLLALAAMLKSAQFPVHGWLTEVMEAPTPVSALLHAGVVNAGGFLIVRFADVLAASPVALYTLLLVGGITALFGSLVMLTQRSVKAALAYSTIAQMGFMLLQCGLGAFSSALLHIVAHSLYKAHAFLSSGSIVDLARGSGAQGSAATLRLPLLLGSVVLALLIFGAWSWFLDMTVTTKPAIAGLGFVLLLGMMHLIIQSGRGAGSAVLFLRVGSTAAVVGGLYFTLQALAMLAYEGAVPPVGALDAVQWCLLGLVLAGFLAATLLQWSLPRLQQSRFGQALWVHLSNGLYVNQLFDQAMGVHRLPPESRA